MNTNEKTQKWENLKLYKNGKAVPMPDNFVCREHGGHYIFEILARFAWLEDAEAFAEMKSKKLLEEWAYFSIVKNLSGDPLGEYYVYYVIDCTTDPHPVLGDP